MIGESYRSKKNWMMEFSLTSYSPTLRPPTFVTEIIERLHSSEEGQKMRLADLIPESVFEIIDLA